MTTAVFDEYYRDYHDQLFKVAYRIAGNREDAEDALQEAYLNAMASFDSFRGESTVSTWLYRITVNAALKFVKRRREFPVSAMARAAGISDELFFERLKSFDSVEDTVLTDNIRENCLQMFIECMPRQQRVAYVLKELLGLSCKEVAAIMGISVQGVKTNVYRARQHMVNNLEGRCALIKKGNPCQCGLWTAYALKTGKESQFPQEPVACAKQRDYRELCFSELNTLGKIRALYSSEPKGEPSDAFLARMRTLSESGELTLLK